MKRLLWLLLLGLFGVGAYLLGLVWPPDQVVASLFGRSGLGVLLADAKAWIWSSLVVVWGWFWGVHYSVQIIIVVVSVGSICWLFWDAVCAFFRSLWEWFCSLFDF